MGISSFVEYFMTCPSYFHTYVSMYGCEAPPCHVYSFKSLLPSKRKELFITEISPEAANPTLKTVNYAPPHPPSRFPGVNTKPTCTRPPLAIPRTFDLFPLTIRG